MNYYNDKKNRSIESSLSIITKEKRFVKCMCHILYRIAIWQKHKRNNINLNQPTRINPSTNKKRYINLIFFFFLFSRQNLGNVCHLKNKYYLQLHKTCVLYKLLVINDWNRQLFIINFRENSVRFFFFLTL